MEVTVVEPVAVVLVELVVGLPELAVVVLPFAPVAVELLFGHLPSSS